MVGLCMGFSLLSGFEFIYFFTLRMAVDSSRAYKKERQAAKGPSRGNA